MSGSTNMLSGPNISKMLADTLDANGYSEKRIQERIWINDKASFAKTLSTREIMDNQTIEKFLVGSQREGISLFGESDSDWMQINTSVVCTDKLRNIKDERNEQVIFRLDRKNTPAGYAQLRYNARDKNTHPYFANLQHALEETQGGTFLSSAKYMDVNEDVFYNSQGCIGRNTVYMDRQGPSIPKIVIGSCIKEVIFDKFDVCRDVDFVRGFRCFCPSLFNKWLHRTRLFNWPDKETKDKVSTAPVHVVPVGLANTPNENLQWRISFTMAEICLVQSFNETQRKMLILLRFIARYILKPVASEVTSYIMKNVTFWLVERTPADKFTNDKLFDRIMDAIDLLILSVKHKKLQNYMLPERNILQGKLQGKQRKVLIAKLLELKVNGRIDVSKVLQTQNIDQDYSEIADWLTNTDFKNQLDKIQTVLAFPVSLAQQANRLTACYHCYFGIRLLFTPLLYYMNCFSMFGFKWLSNPLEIDLVEKERETKTFFYEGNRIAQNKTKTLNMFKLEPCGWLYYKTHQICGRYTNVFVCVFLFISFLIMICLYHLKGELNLFNQSQFDKILTVLASPVSHKRFTTCCHICFGIRLIFTPPHCFSTLEIDLVEKEGETKTFFHEGNRIAQNKINALSMFKLEPCGWPYYKTYQIFGRYTKAFVCLFLSIYFLIRICL